MINWRVIVVLLVQERKTTGNIPGDRKTDKTCWLEFIRQEKDMSDAGSDKGSNTHSECCLEVLVCKGGMLKAQLTKEAFLKTMQQLKHRNCCSKVCTIQSKIESTTQIEKCNLGGRYFEVINDAESDLKAVEGKFNIDNMQSLD